MGTSTITSTGRIERLFRRRNERIAAREEERRVQNVRGATTTDEANRAVARGTGSEALGPAKPPEPSRSSRPPWVKVAFKTLLGIVVLVLGIFCYAGSWAWPEAWACVALYGAWAASTVFWLYRHDPTLLRARLNWNLTEEGQKDWDKWFMKVATPVFLVAWVVPGWDRNHGLTHVPFPLAFLGFMAMAFGMALISWAMKSNSFLFRTVRIDVEGGHRVITHGPYALVRHPMYLGVILLYLGFPLGVGSFLGLLPAALAVAALVVRTVLEDKTLRDELPGYREYAEKTPYRLVPWIW